MFVTQINDGVVSVVMKASGPRELLVSVDIEASGPSPSVASLISIGACLVDRPEVGLYLELRPIADKQWDEGAATVHGLSRVHLEREGLEPAEAMSQLEAWLVDVSDGARPIFVGFNAPFDWMFVADYFWRYLGRNPFGVSALDLKSYYMASAQVPRWEQTRRVYVDERLGLAPDHSHQALEDARGQSVLARILMGQAAETAGEATAAGDATQARRTRSTGAIDGVDA